MSEAFPDRNPNLLIVTEEQKLIIRKSVNIHNEEELQKEINSILEWYEKQQHLPRIKLDRNIIERIIVSRKGSMEQTKQKIDAMFALKTFMPKLAAPRDVFQYDIQKNFKAMIFAPLPKLNLDNTRVNIYRYTCDVDSYDFPAMLNYLFMSIEYRLQCDYSAGDRSLIDFTERRVSHLSKESPTMIRNAEIFVRKAYGIRLRGVHIINAPSFLQTIMNVVKSVISDKLKNRMFIHDSYEDLHKYIDKDILPVEYGGNERSVFQIADEWRQEFGKKSVREYLLKQENLRSNENLRVAGLDENAMDYGMFRVLEID